MVSQKLREENVSRREWSGLLNIVQKLRRYRLTIRFVNISIIGDLDRVSMERRSGRVLG